MSKISNMSRAGRVLTSLVTHCETLAWLIQDSSPTNGCTCANMWIEKWFSYYACCQQVSMCQTTGESEDIHCTQLMKHVFIPLFRENLPMNN